MDNRKIIQGDCLEVLKTLPDESVNCCVTSPPYYALRDYGVDGQIGLEDTPEEYIEKLTKVFHEVKRVLKSDGTLWLNIGDSYYGSGSRGYDFTDKWTDASEIQSGSKGTENLKNIPKLVGEKNGYKNKDLIGIPWMLAFALRTDGWYLRQEIIWAKPNPMPESVKDRCTKSHEQLFLLSKSGRYYFDAEAIAEPCAESSIKRLQQDIENQEGSYTPLKRNGNMKAVFPRFGGNKYGDNEDEKYAIYSGNEYIPTGKRNKRDVWVVSVQPTREAHFATFPEKLVEPCIKAGCPAGGIVLDPFFGSGTTGKVAAAHGRDYIGIELNPQYIEISKKRTDKVETYLF